MIDTANFTLGDIRLLEIALKSHIAFRQYPPEILIKTDSITFTGFKKQRGVVYRVYVISEEGRKILDSFSKELRGITHREFEKKYLGGDTRAKG